MKLSSALKSRVPDAVQRETKWSGALLIRDRHRPGRSRVCSVPLRFARAALRPDTLFNLRPPAPGPAHTGLALRHLPHYICGTRRTMSTTRRPADIARRSAEALRARPRDAFRRETFALPREQAREKAREMFRRFPKAAYMTEIESWRELPGDRIEFTMRRLPSAD